MQILQSCSQIIFFKIQLRNLTATQNEFNNTKQQLQQETRTTSEKHQETRGILQGKCIRKQQKIYVFLYAKKEVVMLEKKRQWKNERFRAERIIKTDSS